MYIKDLHNDLKREKLEKELKLFEKHLQNYKNQKECINSKIKFECSYKDMRDGIRIRSSGEWFEQGEN